MGTAASVAQTYDRGAVEAAVGPRFNEALFAQMVGPDGMVTKEQLDALKNTGNEFPKHGITLAAIDEFIAAHGGESAFAGLTTTQVSNAFLVPSLSEWKCSYCKKLLAIRSPHVGIAKVFISHAWMFNFLELCSALRDHFAATPDIVIWLDMFSNDQINAPAKDFDWWSTTFRSAIKQFGRTVMVLAPWSNPIPLTRAWCLFEIYCTVSTESKFEIALSSAEKDSFFKSMEDDFDSINRMISSVDAEVSQAFKAEDRERIFDAVRKSVGFAKVNTLVFTELRKWVIHTTLARIQQETDVDKALALKFTLGWIYYGQSQIDDAGKCWEECYKGFSEKHGPYHFRTLRALNYKSSMKVGKDQSRIEAVLPEIKACSDLCDLHLGVRHQDSLSAKMNYGIGLLNFAVLKQCEGDAVKAADILQETYAAQVEVMGENHFETLFCLTALAGINGMLRRVDVAEQQFKRCGELKLAKFGEGHPETLKNTNLLGVFYCENGKKQEGVAMLKRTRELAKIKLGTSHDTYTVAQKILTHLGEK